MHNDLIQEQKKSFQMKLCHETELKYKDGKIFDQFAHSINSSLKS